MSLITSLSTTKRFEKRQILAWSLIGFTQAEAPVKFGDESKPLHQSLSLSWQTKKGRFGWWMPLCSGTPQPRLNPALEGCMQKILEHTNLTNNVMVVLLNLTSFLVKSYSSKVMVIYWNNSQNEQSVWDHPTCFIVSWVYYPKIRSWSAYYYFFLEYYKRG